MPALRWCLPREGLPGHAVATLFGQVTMKMPRFRCARCGGTETGIGWPSHCRSTPGLDRIRAHLSALMTYPVAAELLEQLFHACCRQQNSRTAGENRNHSLRLHPSEHGSRCLAAVPRCTVKQARNAKPIRCHFACRMQRQIAFLEDKAYLQLSNNHQRNDQHDQQRHQSYQADTTPILIGLVRPVAGRIGI
jgi:hypothetical protein